jgi:hypothetical protein
VARTLEEIPEQYESAVREVVTAFGRGECLVEKFLDRPRHVETQCSTWRRVFTSRNEMVPSWPTRNSQVPAPTYPASCRIAFDDS